jgi:RHS repeat-associated protein
LAGKEKKIISGTTEIIIFEQKTDTITYITSPEGLTAIVVASSNTAGREWYWVFTDHLGSITALVRNSDGQEFEMSYDAWGNRRDPATWETYTNNMPTLITDRGYTGHEHLDEFSLINMNGRLYDPQTTRFLSPDPFIADPSNPAGYNPYAYVLNNPLKYTDPSGYVVDPVSIAAYIIAAAIIYSNAAKINGDPATGKYEWDLTKWFGKDKPGFGGIGFMSNSSFTNSTYFVSINPTNGGGGTVGYNTQYGWGSGSSPQDMYFPNHNSGASEAAAVNNIAKTGNFNFSSSQGNYMDALITIVFAFNQYHVVSSIGPLGPPKYGTDGGIYFANSTAGYESTMTHPSYAPGYVPPSLSSSGEINIFEPNIFESFATSKIGSTFIGRIAYGIVDDGWVTMCCLTIGHKNAFHINGAGVIGNETVNSGLNTLTSFVPLSSTSKFLGMGTKTLNAGQFNKLYKGTGVTAAKNNGVFIRQFNGNIRQSNNFNFLWNYFLNPTTYSLGYMNIK